MSKTIATTKAAKTAAQAKRTSQNKSDFIARVAAKMNSSQKEAGIFVQAVLDTLQETLGQGIDQVFVGFGTFAIQARAARQGRNPSTGEPLTISAKRVPVFKPGALLKQVVTNGH